MIEIGDYSKVYKCPVCNTPMRLIEKEVVEGVGTFQWIYDCDAYDHNVGMGVAVQRAKEDEESAKELK
ncbi:hypothetical protein KAU43_06305 [candidate division WOR-3 bacterium]|nr:hypothetical protein [candidate division WOR-3 bacterium]